MPTARPSHHSLHSFSPAADGAPDNPLHTGPACYVPCRVAEQRATGKRDQQKPPKLQDGAPKIAKLPYKWLYGRYNYS